jgi:hypothetical protein
VAQLSTLGIADTLMKVFVTILILAAFLSITRAAQATNAVQTSSSPLKLILNCDPSFDTAADVKMDLIYRNTGVTNYLDAMALAASRTVVWDGKDYEKHGFAYAGPMQLCPLQSMTIGFHLSGYSIPSAALASGRHSVAVKVTLSESNTLTTDTLTIFIGKEHRAGAK